MRTCFVIAGKAKEVFPKIERFAKEHPDKTIMASFPSVASNSKRCPQCGADLSVWKEVFGEDHICEGG